MLQINYILNKLALLKFPTLTEIILYLCGRSVINSLLNHKLVSVVAMYGFPLVLTRLLRIKP